MDNQLPKNLIIALSVVQGIILTLLYRSVEHQIWPGTNMMWLIAFATFAISFPLLTILSITQKTAWITIKLLLPFTLLLSLLGAYVGFQQEPAEFVRNGTLVFVFGFTSLIASFKALMYVQQYLSNQPISYSRLFKLSWRNFVIFAECSLFVLIFWGILHLGARLFSILEIDFFNTLLQKDWFIIPILTLTFGFAIIVFRNIMVTADSISKILQTLIKFLLPALTIVSLGFLATLPFTGLEALWKTGSGSLLVMWLQALTLFFVNSVYQDISSERPYHISLHRLIFFGVALLPIYSLISIYGLWLRVDQYGLTVSRCWAILVCSLLTCFSVGYLFGILKKRDAWIETLSKVNISMGLVVLVFMLFVNSPILNFQGLSASSQIKQLENGQVTIEAFDFRYFERHLGRQGYLAIQTLKAEATPEIVAYIDRMYVPKSSHSKDKLTQETFEQSIIFWPNQQAFPDTLIAKIYNEVLNRTFAYSKQVSYYFIAQDLNQDSQVEYIVIEERNHFTSARFWQFTNDEWQSRYIRINNPSKNQFIKQYILDNKIKVVKPKWQQLQIGDLTLAID